MPDTSFDYKPPRSPLRYPGGKSRAVDIIRSFIPKDVTTLCSPFLGGASIELACTDTMKIIGYDSFKPLVNFWNVLLNKREALVDAVRKRHPMTRENFYALQKHFFEITDMVESAAAFFVLNRSSFSGLTLSGGMSPRRSTV